LQSLQEEENQGKIEEYRTQQQYQQEVRERNFWLSLTDKVETKRIRDYREEVLIDLGKSLTNTLSYLYAQIFL